MNLFSLLPYVAIGAAIEGGRIVVEKTRETLESPVKKARLKKRIKNIKNAVTGKEET